MTDEPKPEMKRKRKIGPMPTREVRWVIASPHCVIETTLARQRKGAWSMFSFAISPDVERWKRDGYRAVKVYATLRRVKP